jgi:hypothetical protein
LRQKSFPLKKRVKEDYAMHTLQISDELAAQLDQLEAEQ